MQEHSDEVRKWYNGYLFGEEVIHNPWSVLCFLDRPADGVAPYWINSSDNALIRNLITQADQTLQSEVEGLLCGQTVRTALDENVVLRDIESSRRTLWSLLVFSGYLKPVAH